MPDTNWDFDWSLPLEDFSITEAEFIEYERQLAEAARLAASRPPLTPAEIEANRQRAQLISDWIRTPRMGLAGRIPAQIRAQTTNPGFRERIVRLWRSQRQAGGLGGFYLFATVGAIDVLATTDWAAPIEQYQRQHPELYPQFAQPEFHHYDTPEGIEGAARANREALARLNNAGVTLPDGTIGGGIATLTNIYNTAQLGANMPDNYMISLSTQALVDIAALATPGASADDVRRSQDAIAVLASRGLNRFGQIQIRIGAITQSDKLPDLLPAPSPRPIVRAVLGSGPSGSIEAGQRTLFTQAQIAGAGLNAYHSQPVKTIVPDEWKSVIGPQPNRSHALYINDQICGYFGNRQHGVKFCETLNRLLAYLGYMSVVNINDFTINLNAVMWAGSNDTGSSNGFIEPWNGE